MRGQYAMVVGKDDLPPLPFCTHAEREEGWWLFITDPAANLTLSSQRVDAKGLEAAQRNPKVGPGRVGRNLHRFRVACVKVCHTPT